MSERFELGDRVRILGTAIKRLNPAGGTVYREEGLPTRWNYPAPKRFTEGVIVGRRTVSEGVTDYCGGEYIPVYNLTKTHEVWLVAFDMRMKPAMCFDHQVQGFGDA